MDANIRPLEGVRVLDFSTLLPGPLATLILAEAGAEVIKIERPGSGDESRASSPQFGDTSAYFALMNRGKRSLALDLKSPEARARLEPLLASADVLVEQFRPGVMERLGLDYETLSAHYPRLIYCSITGFGQSGPKSHIAGHDLNYAAATGMLPLTLGPNGGPAIPPALTADIAGGSYPAIINILLALQARERTQRGRRLDIVMGDNLFPFLFWALGANFVNGAVPKPGGELITGGSPRYHIYETSDHRFLAAAPVEDRFWRNFCDAIDLPPALRDDSVNPDATLEAVRATIAARTRDEWIAVFGQRDVCVTPVQTIQDAVNDPHFRDRGLFSHALKAGDKTIPALPIPLDASFRDAPKAQPFPTLGEANASF